MEQLHYIASTSKMPGHINRLQIERPTRAAMYWVPEDGKKERRLKMTWRSTFKEDLEDMGFSWH